MSLVADYGSDHESDDDVDVKPVALPTAPRSLLGQLPPPKKTSANAPSKLFGSLLPPPSKNKDKLQFKLPVAAIAKDQRLNVDDDDTWRPPVKRAKADVQNHLQQQQQQPVPQQSKPSLSSFLPAPKHSSLGSGAALGGGMGGSKLQLDHDDDEDNRPAAQPSHAAEPAPSATWQQPPEQVYSHQHQNGEYAGHSNDADTAYVSTSYPTDAYNYDYAQTSTSYTALEYAPTSYSYAAPETAAGPAQDDELTRVLRGEQERERKRTRGRGQDIPIFTEVKQQDLTAGARPPEAMNTTGIAFGPQHPGAADKKGNGVSKVAKRKHQITALLSDSRARERELLDRKSQGLKTKGETMAKYGW
eukprot:jgi/Chlat1/1421/Chrsp12S01989